MNDVPQGLSGLASAPDAGLACLCGIAAYYRIPVDLRHLERELALGGREASAQDLIRAAAMAGMRARRIETRRLDRLKTIPVPAIIRLVGGTFAIYAGRTAGGQLRLADPVARAMREVAEDEFLALTTPEVILVQRRFAGAGIAPRAFSLRWFLPSIWRHRWPLAHVLVASLFIQLFALLTPLFFQVTVDKVLLHNSVSTLYVLVGGLVALGIFEIALQYLRSYALSHTTSRIDVELGQRLFQHLLRLPLGYFETRPAGQTVARMRELETIRSFLTGQGLFSAIDLVFAVIFVVVLAAYSWVLMGIVVATIPVYLAITALLRPALRDRVNEKFDRGAESNQFLVETVVGVQTLKAAAVEPAMQAQWEDRLAAYVRTAFKATMLATLGQNAIQYVGKLTTARLLLFGAKAVMEGSLTVGGLIACNMIAGQVIQPVLRLSQLWQDVQQVQISIERIGDILNATPERQPATASALPPPRGAIEFRNVRFRYRAGAPEVLKNVSMTISPGEVIGIVGASGSGKSTLTKLVQRFYTPEEGQVLVDRVDLAQVDPAWLRRNMGVVLQENLLFNRSIHDNVALANPAMSRMAVMHVAKLAGADEFINKLPEGYDTRIEERGANLSGGQRQRLAIARALATNPSILIFDEATSALDVESERVIQENMREIVKGRTVIIIAHRLAAVRDCDRIISMADGRIVEVGSHDELVRRSQGVYARLWALQTSGMERNVA